jgi:ribosomal-protein-alanine N-acetyltransferase
MIRGYTPDDIIFIEQLGKVLNPDYKFKMNQFTKCSVYIDNNKIIAFIIYFIIQESAEITDIVVQTEYQGKHIGSALLENVINECRNSKCEKITLEVRASNDPAIAFYKRHGFREASVRKNYYDNGEDALLMVLML